MALDRYSYPFTAIVGQDEMKLALVLNAINPTIGGVLIRGEKGTGKSTAVRALARLLPEQKVVEGCHFGCHPDDPEDWCADCRERSIGGALPVATRRMRVVELPINASEDRVVGTIDLEAALKEGSRRFEPGVLAEANRNILYVDEVNLLDDHIVDVLLDAAAMGVNTVERDGPRSHLAARDPAPDRADLDRARGRRPPLGPRLRSSRPGQGRLRQRRRGGHRPRRRRGRDGVRPPSPLGPVRQGRPEPRRGHLPNGGPGLAKKNSNSSPFMGKYRRSRGWGGRRRPSPWWQLFPIYGEVPAKPGMGRPKAPVTLVATLPHLWGSTGEAGDGAAEGARHLGGNSSPFMGKYPAQPGDGAGRAASPWWQLFPISGEVPATPGM